MSLTPVVVGVLSLPNWFHLQWSHNMQIFPTAVKEFFPMVIAAAIHGNHWSGKLKVDNIALVHD